MNSTDAQRLQRAYVLTLARKPTAHEIEAALAYIGVAEHKDAGPDARQKAWQSYCRILMASNEFIYVD